MTQKETIQWLQTNINKYENKLYPIMIDIFAQLRDKGNNSKLTEAIKEFNERGVLEYSAWEAFEGLLYNGGINEQSLTSIIDEAFLAGATGAYYEIPKKFQDAFNFDPQNTNTAKFLKQYKIDLIREITDTSKEAIRDTLAEGYANQKGSTKIAREIREVVGLTQTQAKAVRNFRNQLETQSTLGTTAPKNRRLNAIDRRIAQRQIREGGMSQKQIDDMVDKYTQSLINKRSKDIARTESHRAYHAGRLDSINQQIEQGLLPKTTRKVDITAKDERVRATHRVIPSMNNGTKGIPINQPFKTPMGNRMYPPYDVNCRCSYYFKYD
jgi:hypothetical protein